MTAPSDPDVIVVRGMPEVWLRKIWEGVQNTHVMLVCDPDQFKKMEEWRKAAEAK